MKSNYATEISISNGRNSYFETIEQWNDYILYQSKYLRTKHKFDMSWATRSIRRNNDIDVTQFMKEVHKNIQSARLQCVTRDGSNANMEAIMLGSNSNISGYVIIACGSYIASDNSPIQALSTSTCTNGVNIGRIKNPKSIKSIVQVSNITTPLVLSLTILMP